MLRFVRKYHCSNLLKQELKPKYPFNLLNLKIGKFRHVKIHPNSETMYISDVDMGNGSTKQICSGIRKLLPIESLQDQLCVVVDNMKKCKLRGEVSEAMILCGETENDGKVRVELCQPDVQSNENLDHLIGKQVKVDVNDEIISRKIKPKEWNAISSSIYVGDNGVIVFHDSVNEKPLFVETKNKILPISVKSLPRGSKVK